MSPGNRRSVPGESFFRPRAIVSVSPGNRWQYLQTSSQFPQLFSRYVPGSSFVSPRAIVGMSPGNRQLTLDQTAFLRLCLAAQDSDILRSSSEKRIDCHFRARMDSVNVAASNAKRIGLTNRFYHSASSAECHVNGSLSATEAR